jgi:hypothetical protein
MRQGGKVDDLHAIAIGAGNLPGDGQGNGCFSDAAGTGNGNQTCSRKVTGDFGNNFVAAENSRQRDG